MSQPPDALTSAKRAHIVADQLSEIQEGRERVVVQQEANEHASVEPVPGLAPIGEENGQPIYQTYGERIAGYDAAEARVWAYAEKHRVTRLAEAMIAADRARAEVEELSTMEAD